MERICVADLSFLSNLEKKILSALTQYLEKYFFHKKERKKSQNGELQHFSCPLPDELRAVLDGF